MEIIEHPYHAEDEIRIAGRTLTLSRKEKDPILRRVVEEAVAEMRIPISVLEPVTFHLLRQGFGPMGRHYDYGDESHIVLGPSFDEKRDYSTPIHELGHCFCHRYMDAPFVEEYKDIRGRDRITEAIAEDFRLIFGGPKAREDPPKERDAPREAVREKLERLFLSAIFAKMERKKPLSITMFVGQNWYLVNGERKLMDTAPFIKDSRTFVPIRFVAEALGCRVGWEEKTRKVTIERAV